MVCGEALITLLKQYGVDTVFGIPGVHTLELYRPLKGSGIRHITPRHEQGAGFMADGYARASGRPGVCFLISGPGVTNAATAIAQAYSDSVPMLVISSVHRRRDLGLGRGMLHELPSQQDLMANITAFSHTLLDPDALPEVVARAFAVFRCARPRPVHIEIPIDILSATFNGTLTPRPHRAPPGPSASAIIEAANFLGAALRPTLLLGGGAVDASEPISHLVKWLDSPVVLTNAAKGVIPANHPLCLGSTLRRTETQALLASSDVVLAIGTELGETDAWNNGQPLVLGERLIRIDIDPQQLERMCTPDVGIVSDARLALEVLLSTLCAKDRPANRENGATRAASTLSNLKPDWRPDASAHAGALAALMAAVPDDAIVVADSAQIVYTGSQIFPTMRPRHWLTSTTGFGTLGYALPAAIGAKVAFKSQAVVCLIGDGGLLFTLPELAAAVEQCLAIPIVVWNNQGYAEIGDYMDKSGISRCGVDLTSPDFVTLALGFGCSGVRVSTASELESSLLKAFSSRGPTIIEVNVPALINT
jgi:acetolactate synthase-1/2/3 large subunit